LKRERLLVASRWLFVGCGISLVGLGLYFILLRPPLLPEDPRYMGASLEQIQQALPGLAAWLGKVFTVMGGFMATAGILTLFAAARLPEAGGRGFTLMTALAGVMGVGLMSAVNFVLASDFRWVLLVPAVAWLLAVMAAARSEYSAT
jgi:hypothetical protein